MAWLCAVRILIIWHIRSLLLQLISFHKSLVYATVKVHATVIVEISIPEQWPINLQSLYLLSLPRVNRSYTCERNMLVKGPLLVNGSGTCEQDLQFTSATPRVNGIIAHANACNSITFHIPVFTWHPRQAIPYTMSCPPGNSIHHAVATRPYHISCRAHQAISYTRPCNMPCYVSLDHTLYHIMSARPNYIPCHARHAIPYTIVRPYHILCHARRAISFPWHARQATPYTMPCLTRPEHIPYHARQVIPYTMPCRDQRLLR